MRDNKMRQWKMDDVWVPYGLGARQQVPVGCKGKSSRNPDGKEGHRAGEWGRGWMGDGRCILGALGGWNRKKRSGSPGRVCWGQNFCGP